MNPHLPLPVPDFLDLLSWTLAVFRVAGVESNVIERWILG
jgi:hypothetical protein